ncbi:Ankyrin repeat domain-containing protein 54 [Hondaea fermentalgiana]|uniref:Ankyrin repeat domain-containing protein 54 n=1 Tax=Hondaea fermentalgiana TaxID=2315210 RepID=A0A2R5GE88_9STRA|nr:Ankyrin repeat domain-containing protein 54 [Hondaea fermentalgiana]|eukprot:GBG28048.1 Ankyrin repeat domain-containing protein 54 [Hondaea fermentalgiana]
MPRWTPKEAEAALLRAIATDDYFTACESIRRGAPPNAEVSQGWTALLRCVAGRDTGRVQALIKLGVDVNHMSSKGLGQTPLVLAVSLNDLAMVRALLEHGADVNKENACALSPLTMALQLGRIDTMATYLVETACARVDDPNADGHTPLALCVVKFDLGLSCAQFLIRHGAQATNELVQLSTQKRKHTLRRYFEEQLFANRTRNPQTFSDHDERKVKDNFIRSHEEDRILEAIRKGQLSPDHQTSQGETALAFAVQHDRCLFILELVKLGATIDLQSETHGISALHEACRRGRFLAARLLLHILHADPDVLTSDGLSPLMLAAQHGHIEVVRLLLGVRAFARYKLPSGLNAKLVALGARRHDILHLLEAFEQDVGSCILGSYYAPAEKADMLFLASQEALVQDYCRKASFYPKPGGDPHRRLVDLLRQLQLAELLIDVLDEPEKGIREAVALLAAQKRAHAPHKHDVGGQVGLQAVPTLLCLVRGSLILGRAREARRFALAAVQECLVLDQANGSILLDTLNEASRLLVSAALEAERQGLLACKSCNWQLATAQEPHAGEFGNTAGPMCKFCRDVPLIDAVMPQTLEVYGTFLRTPILACIPPILRKSICEELNRGPRCFEPAVQVVMDRLYATVYPKFVRAQWRKHAGFKYVADRFMMEDPLVAASVLRIQRWKRRITTSAIKSWLLPLGGMSKLRVLSIGRNNLKRFEKLEENAETLTEIWASYNQISTLDGLAGLPKLEVLYLSNNSIKDWSELEKLAACTQLKDVLLVGNPIYDDVTPEEARIKVLQHMSANKALVKIDNVLIKPKEREEAASG